MNIDVHQKFNKYNTIHGKTQSQPFPKPKSLTKEQTLKHRKRMRVLIHQLINQRCYDVISIDCVYCLICTKAYIYQ